MASAAAILRDLKSLANAHNVAGMAHFGINPHKRLGISVEQMRRIARAARRDHAAALTLWKTGIPEARIVASMIADPAALRSDDMEAWAVEFDSWDVCDQVCANLFEKTPFARRKIRAWAKRDEEFVKRAAFSLIACLATHDKRAPDEDFLALLPLIERAATDDRNFVRKAVNWALRGIGKRNVPLNKAAIATARRLQTLDSRAARWIAADALRELEGDAVQASLKARSMSGRALPARAA